MWKFPGMRVFSPNPLIREVASTTSVTSASLDVSRWGAKHDCMLVKVLKRLLSLMSAGSD